MKKLRLKKHGTFSIREGWFEKAIYKITHSDKSVFGKNNGVAILGIGANMVTSLRYWMVASGVINNSLRNDLSDFGQLLLRYDPYLNKTFSWWMIHYNLVSNFEDAPVFNLAFNQFNVKNFSKETLNEFVEQYMKENDYDMSNSSMIDADTSVLLRTYLNEKVTNPEDNLNSPLGKLGLLEKNKEGLFTFKHPIYKKLNYLVVYYALIKCFKEEENRTANIDDLMERENSPAKIFNLDKNLFYLYLNDMSQNGLVTVNRTAGLNTVYIDRELTLEEVFRRFFEGR